MIGNLFFFFLVGINFLLFLITSYYTSGRSATLPQFFSVHLLDSFINQTRKVRNTLDKFHPDIELWLGETSTASGGGAPGLSNSYVAGFM